MPNWLKAFVAGYDQRKPGGGYFNARVIFVGLYYALGNTIIPAAQHGQLKAPAQRLFAHR